MTTEIKIGAIALLLIGAITWWNLHDRSEQKIGAVACVEKVAETKAQALAANVITKDDHDAALKSVADGYALKLKQLSDSNGTLAQRLHDAHAALRARAVRTDPGSAGAVRAAPDDAGPSACDRREAVNLEACAANTIELSAIREAWHKLSASDAKPTNRVTP